MRLRKDPLPFIANILLLFFSIVAGTLIYQLIVLLTTPLAFDWLTGLLLVSTLAFFVVIIAGVWLLDLQSRMTLNRRGIYIEPALFKAYTIAWEDIAELTLQDRQGLRLIEYRLKPTSQILQAQPRKLKRTAQRSGGFHGWLPVQSYKLEIKSPYEQYEVKVNRLFPLLRRYWQNPQTREELPES